MSSKIEVFKNVDEEIKELETVEKVLYSAIEKEKLENVEQVLETFIGKQHQIPPMYSAIKVNGKKLYDYD